MEKVKIGKWDAIIISPCEDSGNKYIIYYNGENGAVISGETYKETEDKFIEAMNLAEFFNFLMKDPKNRNMVFEALR